MRTNARLWETFAILVVLQQTCFVLKRFHILVKDGSDRTGALQGKERTEKFPNSKVEFYWWADDWSGNITQDTTLRKAVQLLGHLFFWDALYNKIFHPMPWENLFLCYLGGSVKQLTSERRIVLEVRLTTGMTTGGWSCNIMKLESVYS